MSRDNGRGSADKVYGDNGRGSADKVYVVKIEQVMPDGGTEAVCEGDVLVPATEDIIALDDMLEAVKVYDLWEDLWEDPREG